MDSTLLSQSFASTLEGSLGRNDLFINEYSRLTDGTRHILYDTVDLPRHH